MTADKILAVAKKEIGVTENPAGSNRVVYNTEYYGKVVTGSAYPWCCAFVWWVFKHADALLLFYGGGKTASCSTLLSYYQRNGQTVSGNYQPGDLIFFNFSGGKNAQHIGICESWDGQYITTIDGNTGSSNEANGGAVMRRKRMKKYIVGAARPKYEGGGQTVTIELPVLKKGSKGASVTALQQLLTAKGYDTKGVDGSFGANTEAAVRAFQKAKGLTVDGVCGKNTWTALLTA